MLGGMLASSFASSIAMLAATRLFTGLGIGGMQATTNALTADYANDKWRSAAVSIMGAGYPVGVVTGGAVALHVLAAGDWRHVFLLGAGVAALMVPLVLLFLPEPVNALLANRRGVDLARVNRSLRALGHGEVVSLPGAEREVRTGFGDLFSHGAGRVTLLLIAAYFFHMVTFYFFLKWVPKIVADMGFAASAAGSVLVWTNLGSLVGSVLFGLLSVRIGLRGLLVAFMLAGSAAVVAFGRTEADLHALALAGAITGFFINGVMVGLYALAAASFAPAVRGGGTGLAIGVGRAGAALGPILAGVLFQSGLRLPAVTLAMATGSVVAALAVIAVPRRTSPSR